MDIYHPESLHDKKFLVTGGAGFIGSHIAEYLLKNGAQKVRVLDNMSNGFADNLALLKNYPAFEFMEADIRNFEDCNAACNGMDYLSHQAALGSVPRSISRPVYFNEVNVGGFVNMLKAASDNGIRQTVYASSSSVYGDDLHLPKKEDRVGQCLSPYAATKKTNELYAQVFAGNYGMRLIGFRYFNIFGPRQDPDGPYAAVIPLFVKAILKKLPVFINGDGNQTRDFTYVENAVQVNIRGMLTNNEAAMNRVYNVALGESNSVNFLYDACNAALGGDRKPTYREPRAGDIRDSLADISAAINLLGYQPGKNFGEGLRETIGYFKTRYA